MLSGLCKTYPDVQALDDDALQAAPGRIVGLVGENGAGNITLMKLLGGGMQPGAGRIVIDGQDPVGPGVPQSMGAGIAFVPEPVRQPGRGRDPLKGGPCALWIAGGWPRRSGC